MALLFVWRSANSPILEKDAADQRAEILLAENYYANNIVIVIFGGDDER
jgi:hypothetical protein